MLLFQELSIKLIPLYLSALLGFFAGRLFQADSSTVARLIFYVLAPIVFFSGVVNTELSWTVLSTPLLAYAIGSVFCLSVYRLSKDWWTDNTPNILAYSAGCGNTGYFGIPVALLLFGQQAEGVYILIVLGLSLYENSLGYYMTARGRYTAQEALRQVARLPTTHAFLMGLIVKLLGLPIPHIMQDFFVRIQGTYSTLGMMIIGLGLSSMRRFRIDQRFLCTALLVRFVAWPALILTLVTLDRQLFHIYAPSIHQAFILASIVPLAANTVIFASLLEAQPEKSATAVLISTLIAMLYVPFMASLLL